MGVGISNPPGSGGSSGDNLSVTFPTPQEIIISHTEDSIKIGDGTETADVTAANALKTDSSHVTQPISGTVAISGTPNVSVSNIPHVIVDSAPALDTTGLATSAKQDTANASLASIDTKLSAPVAVSDNGGSLTVDGTISVSNFPASQPVTGTFWQATQPVSGTVAVTGAYQATQSVSAASLPLPTGASTSDLQGTGNTSLGSIDTKTPALGQALAAASVPVVLTAAQLTTLTPLSTVAVTGPLTDAQLRATAVPINDNGGSLTVDGSVSVSNFPATQAVSGTVSANATLAAETTKVIGTVNIAAAQTVGVTGTFWQATQPISGTVTAGLSAGTNNIGDVDVLSLPALPAGSNAIGKLTANDGVDIGDVTINNASGASAVNIQDGGNSITVDGPLTDAQLRAVAVPVSGTFYQATQPVSGTVSANATLSAETTKVIGTVNIAASQTLATVSAVTAITNALPAGTNNIGDVDVLTLPALPTGANTIGAVTNTNLDVALSTRLKPADTLTAVTTVSTVTNLSQLGGTAISMNTGVRDAGTQRVTIATNDTVPVSGTVTANAGTGTFTTADSRLPTALVSGRLDVNIGASPNTLNVAMAEATVLFKGRASTFNTPGRAGTTGQKLLSLHNASGSTVTCKVTKVAVDLAQTVIKAVTVAPPIIRLWKVTVLPTNGTALTKNKIGGTTTSNASVTTLGDASADNTGSATTLTATLPTGTIITQEYGPRLITAAGYEMADRMEFLGDTTVTLSALEGLVVFIDYTLATQNPTTDRWISTIEWTES